MKQQSGFTLVELIVVVVVIAVLAGVAIPVAQTSLQRSREVDLRRSLRQLRSAIDEYRDFAREKKISMDSDRYFLPEKLEDLVEGIEYKDKQGKRRIVRFLRRIPRDPMTGTLEWGRRSYQDKRDSTDWGGENIWDVYSKSEKKALDGSSYREW